MTYLSGLIWSGAALLLGAAFWSDVRTMRIPNILTGVFFIGGLLLHSISNGLDGFWQAMSGAAAGFLPLLVLYLLRGIGAGDVKLFGAAGAWLGAAAVLELMLYSMLLGGIGGGIYLLAVKAVRFKPAELSDTEIVRKQTPVRFPFMLAVLPAAIVMKLLA